MRHERELIFGIGDFFLLPWLASLFSDYLFEKLYHVFRLSLDLRRHIFIFVFL